MVASDIKDADAANDLIIEVRREHFARLGKPVPEYTVKFC